MGSSSQDGDIGKNASFPHTTKRRITTNLKAINSPGLCGWVDWVLDCEPSGHGFGSQSLHMPGLWARCLVWDSREATTQWCFSPSLSPFFPLCLNINKKDHYKIKNNKQPELPENQTAWNSDNQGFKETFIQTGRRGGDRQLGREDPWQSGRPHGWGRSGWLGN